MSGKAIKLFDMMINNTTDFIKEIRMEVYKLLDLDGKIIFPDANENARLLEQIKTSIDSFAFNVYETQFFQQIQDIIKDEMQKLQTSDNFALVESSLIERLKALKNMDVSLEQDFHTLSSKIASSFHPQEEYYRYFMAREENILNMIKSKNQMIIDALINWTPTLMEELKSIQEKQSQETKQNEPTVVSNNSARSSGSELDNISKINGLINACKNKYNELQRRTAYLMSIRRKVRGEFSGYVYSEKGDVDKSLKQLDEFIQKLSDSKFAAELISKYANIKDMDVLYEKIIAEQVPNVISATTQSKKVDDYVLDYTDIMQFDQFSIVEVNVDELHQRIVSTNNLTGLLEIKQKIESAMGHQYYDTNIRLKKEHSILLDKIISLTVKNTKNESPDPNNPEPKTNTQAVGGTADDINALIDSDQFFSVLQGIQKQDIIKHQHFIILGYSTMFKRWHERSINFKYFPSQKRAFFELEELYKNFQGYLPLDMLHSLKTYIDPIREYIRKEELRFIQEQNRMYYGVNSHSNQQARSSMGR